MSNTLTKSYSVLATFFQPEFAMANLTQIRMPQSYNTPAEAALAFKQARAADEFIEINNYFFPLRAAVNFTVEQDK